ncbi:MAG: hypothetical protein KIT69_20775, partial [Propionibacteriaceae bacterium]|nr:hypothetical protein [Propionibacteriaceae bacterium]
MPDLVSKNEAKTYPAHHRKNKPPAQPVVVAVVEEAAPDLPTESPDNEYIKNGWVKLKPDEIVITFKELVEALEERKVPSRLSSKTERKTSRISEFVKIDVHRKIVALNPNLLTYSTEAQLELAVESDSALSAS